MRPKLPHVPSLPALARRVGATTVNAIEVARHGGFETDEDYSPYEVVSTHRIHKLRRYFPQAVPPDAPVLLLVHPLMISGDVWDIAPKTSAVAALHGMGIDVWTIDFGRPEHEPGGLERTLTDHAMALNDAVDEVREATGRDIALGGQSQGGMFCYQVAAWRRGEGIDSLITFGSPVDTRAPLGVPMSPETAATIAQAYLSSGLARKVSIPGWAMRGGTQLLTPIGVAKGKAQWYLNLHDRERLLPRERLRQYLDGQGWTAYSGPAFAELLEQFMVHNRMLEGGFVFQDRLVSLADIDVPILTVVGSTDVLATPPAVRAIRRAAPRADVYELTIPIGHFGIIGGATAGRITWPNVAAWIAWRNGEAELPPAIVPASEIPEWDPADSGLVRRTIGWTADRGVGGITTGAHLLSQASDVAKDITELAVQGARQIPKLPTILEDTGGLHPGAQVSLASLLDDAARRNSDHVVYAFGDRVIRHGEFKHRVDSIVLGMLSLGMRPGERIGVLMESRPSALSVLAAISRLGATAVLIRPEGVLARELELGQVNWMISDPDHAVPDPADGVTWCVLGIGSGERDLPDHVLDMEKIDVAGVRLPHWFRPNPRKGSDIAFVLFAGEGANTREVPITNRRWARSALGAVRSAGLRPADTVYSVTPLYHSSAILHAMAGAIASGARFALASGTDPDTFWDEVRRYGASHVSYTWTSLENITDGPEHPAERDHPIRVFMGSGMPRGLWRRVVERFPSTRVVEVYASTEGDAILASSTSGEIGCVGRPVPGSPEVRVVQYATASHKIVRDNNGFGREERRGSTGMLVVRGDATSRRGAVPLLNLFEPGDSWVATNDLFIRDEAGDLWFVDHIGDLIPTSHGPVPPSDVSHALERVQTAALATAYAATDGGRAVIVAAMQPLPGAQITGSQITVAVRSLPVEHRPAYVVATAIPRTAWSRPQVTALRKRGVPRRTKSSQVWRLAEDGLSYEPL
jgi:putative long chain acyl-CoA synthase